MNQKRSDASKKGWTEERKKKASERSREVMNARLLSGEIIGRTKGTKNKNPYPRTEAVLQKLKAQVNYPGFISEQGKSHKDSYTDEVRQKLSEIKIKQIQEGVGSSMKGRFKPKNPSKYQGNVNNIIYRSSWELKCMMNFDSDPSILRWCSEEIMIPYTSPVDNKIHRYLPDFVIVKKTGESTTKTIMIEVKPAYQTQAPVRGNKKQKRYINEVFTYGVNDAKWKSAQRYCSARGWEFKILTEKELKVF